MNMIRKLLKKQCTVLQQDNINSRTKLMKLKYNRVIDKKSKIKEIFNYSFGYQSDVIFCHFIKF